MKYNGLYFALFRGTMKKVLSEHCGKAFARDTMKKAHPVYKELVTEADDIGYGNPWPIMSCLLWPLWCLT
ncbi:MAG: hypothetical protein Q4F83_01075 [Eubacteriales bacterium]|nr:hypothetical protein [Eubacteriales bacterium]